MGPITPRSLDRNQPELFFEEKRRAEGKKGRRVDGEKESPKNQF